MPDYHYSLDAPFESDKFFEMVESEMNGERIKIGERKDHVVSEMIELGLKIKEHLDNLSGRYYINMNTRNIIYLAGYVETILISSGSILNSELINLYIEYCVYKYLVNSIRVTDNKIKTLSENLMSVTVLKINNMINKK